MKERELHDISDEELAIAVKACNGLMKLVEHLKVGSSFSSRVALMDRIIDLGIPFTHFKRVPYHHSRADTFQPRWLNKLSDAEFTRLMAAAKDDQHFCEMAGLPQGKALTISALINRAKLLGIPFGNVRNAAHRESFKKTLLGTLKENSTPPKGSTNYFSNILRKYGIVKEECCECGGKEWCGHPMPLTLIYRNGNKTDLRPENLALACQNCWAQLTFEERTKAARARMEKMKATIAARKKNGFA